MPMPLVLGHEVAGRVARLGPGTQRLREGDAVGVAWFHYTCGGCDYCRRDLEVFCDHSEITGVTVPAITILVLVVHVPASGFRNACISPGLAYFAMAAW